MEQLEISLPPSSLLILEIIRNEGIIDLSALIAKSQLPRRTVFFALRRLRMSGLIDIKVCLQDARRRHYCVAIRR